MLRVVPKVVAVAVLSMLTAGSAFAQEQGGLLVQNPLDEIRAALAGTLEDSGVPFTDEQVQAIALVMDEQRRVTEELFGQVLDFSGGPPQGDQLDQALAGIAWMSEAFLANVDEVLTPAQSEAWMRARLVEIGRQNGCKPLKAASGSRLHLARGAGTTR